jgi:hypothetical protein
MRPELIHAHQVRRLGRLIRHYGRRRDPCNLQRVYLMLARLADDGVAVSCYWQGVAAGRAAVPRESLN